MTQSNSSHPKGPRVLTGRRIALLASAAGISAALLLAGPGGYRPFFGTPSANAAESTMQHQPGFADLVTKVKPAVISVRVKISASDEPASMNQNGDDEERNPAQPGSPRDKFFQQFGDQFGHRGTSHLGEGLQLGHLARSHE